MTPLMGAALALLAARGAAAQITQASREAVIGCALPLSGPESQVGWRVLRGVLIAARAFDEGGPGFPLAVAVRDTGGTPEGAQRAVADLVEKEGVVAIVGPVTSRESPGAATAAQARRVPIVTLTQREDVLKTGDFIFRAILTPRDEAQAVALYAANVLHLSRLGVLYPDEPFGRDLARAFSEAAASSNAKVIRASTYKRPADLPNAMDRVLDQHPGATTPPRVEGIFVPDTAEAARVVAARLGLAGAKDVWLLGTSLWNTPESLVGGMLEGAVLAAAFTTESRRATTHAFVSEYRRTFGEDPEAFAAQAYDVTVLLLDLLREEPGAGRERIRWRLQNASLYDGAAGTIRFEGQRDAHRGSFVLGVRGGRMVPLEEADLPPGPGAFP
jgi:branched-chain amino acid transport system substrate-binding protein